MSNQIEEMRSDISKVYLNTSWKKKVANMPDKQVMAIYYSFLAKGKFGHVPNPKRIHSKPIEPVVAYETPFKADQAQQLAFDL